MQNNQYNWWEDPNVPFELKAEQNLFWLIYDENRSLYRRMKKNGARVEKIKGLLLSMRQYAIEHNWLYSEWTKYVRDRNK
jgi:hypothetical protein